MSLLTVVVQLNINLVLNSGKSNRKYNFYLSVS